MDISAEISRWFARRFQHRRLNFGAWVSGERRQRIGNKRQNKRIATCKMKQTAGWRMKKLARMECQNEWIYWNFGGLSRGLCGKGVKLKGFCNGIRLALIWILCKLAYGNCQQPLWNAESLGGCVRTLSHISSNTKKRLIDFAQFADRLQRGKRR